MSHIGILMSQNKFHISVIHTQQFTERFIFILVLKMNSDEDNNPFADPSIRQATAQNMFVDYFLFNFIIQLINSSSNQQTLNEYNPFTNKTVAAKVCLFELFFLLEI